jgi:hypothetical protein
MSLWIALEALDAFQKCTSYAKFVNMFAKALSCENEY